MKRYTASYVATNLLNSDLDDSYELIRGDPIQYLEADAGLCSSDEEDDNLEIPVSQSDESESEREHITLKINEKSFFLFFFFAIFKNI